MATQDALIAIKRTRTASVPNASRARNALRYMATLWLCAAALGQLIFASYIVSLYGRSMLDDAPERWNEVMNRGFVAGDHLFNWVLGLHLMMALAITVGGLLQLIPWLRRYARAFHRWNGRLYLLLASGMAVGGLSLIWIRGGAAGDLPQHLGTSLNALLIAWFVVMAWRNARAGRIDAHRVWALRLFLAVSGVWFFRIGLMLWLALNQAPVGFDPKTFTGPILTTLAFAQTLLPLTVLELYLRASAGRQPRMQWMVSGLLAALTLATLAGIAAAAMILWLPYLPP